MAFLGRRIAAEWAKGKSSRVVGDGPVAVWLRVLPRAAETGAFDETLKQVAADVDALFAGAASEDGITAGRYLPGEAEPPPLRR